MKLVLVNREGRMQVIPEPGEDFVLPELPRDPITLPDGVQVKIVGFVIQEV